MNRSSRKTTRVVLNRLTFVTALMAVCSMAQSAAASGSYSTSFANTSMEIEYMEQGYPIAGPGEAGRRMLKRHHESVDRMAVSTYGAVAQVLREIVARARHSGMALAPYHAFLPITDVDISRRKGFEKAFEGPFPRNLKFVGFKELSFTVTVKGPVSPKELYQLGYALRDHAAADTEQRPDDKADESITHNLSYPSVSVKRDNFLVCSRAGFRTNSAHKDKFEQQLKIYANKCVDNLDKSLNTSETKEKLGTALLPVAGAVIAQEPADDDLYSLGCTHVLSDTAAGKELLKGSNFGKNVMFFGFAVVSADAKDPAASEFNNLVGSADEKVYWSQVTDTRAALANPNGVAPKTPKKDAPCNCKPKRIAGAVTAVFIALLVIFISKRKKRQRQDKPTRD